MLIATASLTDRLTGSPLTAAHKQTSVHDDRFYSVL
jgi:hypothetical protein